MLDPARIRAHFPALSSGAVFLDNPGGTQAALESAERVRRYLLETNANHGGAFFTSRESDAVVAEARAAAADFLGASRPEEIVFGQNMTTLTLQLSRSLARELFPGDELVVTRLDHDANIAPWLLVAADRGCKVRWVDFDPQDCTWSLEALQREVGSKTKLVAVGLASNAVGTINDVAGAARIAHEAGALCFVDAVQYAPHGPIDVQALGCDFLACSAYKFFGPHVGILWGRYELLDRLTAYKVRPAGDQPPDKFETGTLSFEGIAGTLGAFEYLAWVGETFGGAPGPGEEAPSGRRLALRLGMTAIHAHERHLSSALLEGLSSVPGLRIHGIADPARLEARVPTFSFTFPGRHPRRVAEELDREGIYVWDGNYYALAVTERLGLEEKGGLVRAGAVHYNTAGEIDRLVNALKRLA